MTCLLSQAPSLWTISTNPSNYLVLTVHLGQTNRHSNHTRAAADTRPIPGCHRFLFPQSFWLSAPYSCLKPVKEGWASTIYLSISCRIMVITVSGFFFFLNSVFYIMSWFCCFGLVLIPPPPPPPPVIQTIFCYQQGFWKSWVCQMRCFLKELKKMLWRNRGSVIPAGGIAIQRKEQWKLPTKWSDNFLWHSTVRFELIFVFSFKKCQVWFFGGGDFVVFGGFFKILMNIFPNRFEKS